MGKNNIKILLLLVLIYQGYCTACKENYHELNFSKFPNTVNLKGKAVGIKEVIKGCFPNCYDSLLILTSVQGYYKQILLYNLKSFKYLGSAAKLGRGPHEISFPGHIVINKKTGLIWCQDLGKRLLWKFEIDSILANPNYFPDVKSEMPGILAILQLEVYSDSVFSFTGNNPDTLISFFDLQGNIINHLQIENRINLYSIADLSFETKNLMAYYLYAINRKNGRIAIIYNFSDVIVFLDKNGNIIRKLNGPGSTNQIPEYGNANKIMTNSLIESDDNYVYCLYKNKKRCDEITGMIPNNPIELNVYNWNGEPLLKIFFDHPVQTFTIDHINKRIITFSPDIDDLMIYEFSMEKLLNKK
ncbi:MAG: hypothetical protein EPN88_06970 [Bacteroidetes bacterium]|nr:MAG: hypothetical protein EPN88_06970 [Bacteroidota bacterium]